MGCRYAWECQTQEGGWGLDGVLRDQSWKLRGIVNGIDYSEWSPERDTALQSDGYSNYNADTIADGKSKCKAALQRVSLHTGLRLTWVIDGLLCWYCGLMCVG